MSTTPAITVTHGTVADVPAKAFGRAAKWFDIEPVDDGFWVRPNRPLPSRCLFRVAGLFHHRRGFSELNLVMGRLLFAKGATEPQRYKPFTNDPDRTLTELLFPIAVPPDDEWPVSSEHWTIQQAITRRLLDQAGISWTGLSENDLTEAVDYVPWLEGAEGCVLHALSQWTHRRYQCVIEIGSLRGRSLTMLSMGLRQVGSPSMLVSIDPHEDQPENLGHVQLALRQIGQAHRLIQVPCRSDEACALLRPGCASLIFIDGDHTYEQVVADFVHYRDILGPGGYMVFHDYGHQPHNNQPEDHPGVRKAVDEYVLADPAFDPILLAGLMLVVRKNK